MLDKSLIGRRLPSHNSQVERGQLQFFAKATGASDPIYYDRAAAIEAGHPDIPAPPTFAFTLNQQSDDPFGFLRLLGVNIEDILHGEQEFTYFSQIYAGDQITFESEIKDIYVKKGGALEFVVLQISGTNQHGEKVVELRDTTVVRRAEHAQ